jgi:hypothetical protein
MFWIRGYYQCKRHICQDASPRSSNVNEWDERPYNEIEGKPKLTRDSVTQTYQGDFVGEGTIEYLMLYTDVNATYIDLERVVGTLADRRGSFVLRHTGVYEDCVARTICTVVPGSATGELVAFCGEGKVSQGEDRTYPITLEYDFE